MGIVWRPGKINQIRESTDDYGETQKTAFTFAIQPYRYMLCGEELASTEV